jgi:NAD-dependent SIR2 family protein deacetylase
VLAQLVNEKDGFVFTSNVDGYFNRAGIASQKILECHGSINYLQCMNHDIFSSDNCPSWTAVPYPIYANERPFSTSVTIPVCPHCAELARPQIPMFADSQWDDKLTQSQTELYKAWLDKKHSKNIVVIELGPGMAIPPVRWQSESLGVPIIRINSNTEDCRFPDENCVSIQETAINAYPLISKLDPVVNTSR